MIKSLNFACCRDVLQPNISWIFYCVALMLVGCCGDKYASENPEVFLVLCRRMEFTVYIFIFCLFECTILLSWCYPKSYCGHSVKWLNQTALLVGQTFFLYCDVSMIFNATPIPLQFLYAATSWVIILAKEHSLK